MTQEQKLARIYNRRTAYELVLTNGETTFLLVYAVQRTRHVLLERLCKYADALEKLTGAREITFAKKSHGGATMGSFDVKWTGRTQREAIQSGEHTFIGILA
jgi:hypothetical protein